MNRKSYRFFVITGGPGVGKTTLLEALKEQGYKCVPEVAREIIREQMESDGDALPWKNKEWYATLMLERSVRSYLETEAGVAGNEPVFFDRGIPDTLCYAGMIGMKFPKKVMRDISKYIYCPEVFLLPPWEEIYHTDGERKQDWEEAVLTYKNMRETYLNYGYRILEVPKVNTEKRVEFVLGYI
ncbi:MAG: AAA family ATPase [Bacteroidales bacterium]|jgi:predicted ATPase|nr:AAA family ATPase [Bacteroidales bacterium]